MARAERSDLPTTTGDATVIFLHIGKTAGTTMRKILHRNFRRTEVLLIRSAKRADTRPRREDSLRDFAALPEERRRRARLIEGHIIFGPHEHVPGPSTYITLLREPVSLVISQYNFVRRTPGHRLHELVASADLSLEDYVGAGVSLEVDNSQVRAIAGDTATPAGQCTDDMLERAKRNIEDRFAVVGLTERFDETLILLRHAIGLRRLTYVRAKVAPRAARDPLPDSTLAMIRERNRLDVALYEWAAERFERAVREIPGFDEELAGFRRANARYRPWGAMTYTFPKAVAERFGR